jgi:lipid II:glycine glycyltransferase (peptidoglycan interpeptide bridge formation enzyme)
MRLRKDADALRSAADKYRIELETEREKARNAQERVVELEERSLRFTQQLRSLEEVLSLALVLFLEIDKYTSRHGELLMQPAAIECGSPAERTRDL